VHFRLLDDSHPSYHEHPISMPIHEIRQVKSSNGTVQKRVFIKTLLSLGNETYTATLSLTDRKSMKFPMLIGRTFLRGRFIVDVALQYQALEEGTIQ